MADGYSCDVSTIKTTVHAGTHSDSPAHFYPGGAGIAPMGWRNGDRHLGATLQALRDCPCLDGCPSCVQSPKCGNFNDPLDKAGAIRLLAEGLD